MTCIKPSAYDCVVSFLWQKNASRAAETLQRPAMLASSALLTLGAMASVQA